MKLSRIVLSASVGAALLVGGSAVVRQQAGGSRPPAPQPALLAAAVPAGGAPQSSAPSAPASAEDESKIALLTARLLAQSHYSRQPVDDAVASQLLDRYLDALDPQRVFFFQSDVAEFAPLRTTLDDLLNQKGDTSPADRIFARFTERLGAQTAYAKSLLAGETFTFTADETFPVDRKTLPWPQGLDEARALWRQRLRFEYLQEKLNKQKPDQIVKTLTRRYERQQKTVGELDRDDVFELYLTTLAHVYDPHSDYLGKASTEQFSISMRLSLFGVGAVLQSDDGYVKINEVIPGGPAARSKKLKPGDRIVAVAQGEAGGEPVDVVDMKLSRVVEMIRGAKGTKVRLTILPSGAADAATRQTVTIERDEVKLEDQAAKAQLIEVPTGAAGKTTRVGVIDLPLFYQDPDKNKSASADVARLLKKLKQEKVQGVVLDLRRNGGGSLPEAIALAGLFIRQGPVVQVRDQQGKVTVDDDIDPGIAYDGPLVVLTSRFSASASEIVAGCLQDYDRALIVGDPSSFGKGTVQAVVDLAPVLQRANLLVGTNPGSIHLTIQKFYRPGGSSTQLKGVVPDIVLPSASSILEVGEKELDGPLPWDTIPPSRFSRVNRVRPVLAALKQRSQVRVTASKDFAFLRQEIARYQKTAARKVVSLNEAERIRERQEAEARQKARQKDVAARPRPRETVYPLTLKNVDAPGLPKPAPQQAAAAPGTGTTLLAAPSGSNNGAEGGAEPAASSAAASERDLSLDETKRILLDLIALAR